MVTKLIEKRMGQSADTMRPAPGTVRIVIPVNVAGDQLRLRFHNADSVPGQLNHVTVVKSDRSGIIQEETSTEITFDGVQEIQLAPNQKIISDVVDFVVAPGDNVAVSVYSDQAQSSTNGIDPLMHQSAPGDHCAENFEDVDTTPPQMKAQGTKTYPQIPLLAGAEVHTAKRNAVVVCLGDSITQQGHWYVRLQERLHEAYPGKVSILNAGIGGNRLVRDCSPRLGGMFGTAGINRFERDVLSVPGVTHMVFALGVNDIMHADGMMAMLDPAPAPTPEEFGKACADIIEKAKEKGIKTIAFTVYPAVLSADKEKEAMFYELYLGYNAAIRNAGFDYVFETESILAAQDGCGYREDVCKPDNLHLNEKGGRILAEALPLEWFV